MRFQNGNGRIHMNMLWELADSQRILEGVSRKGQGPDQRRYLRRRDAVSSWRAGF